MKKRRKIKEKERGKEKKEKKKEEGKGKKRGELCRHSFLHPPPPLFFLFLQF
jgi:hypothetical protein